MGSFYMIVTVDVGCVCEDMQSVWHKVRKSRLSFCSCLTMIPPQASSIPAFALDTSAI